MNEPVVVCGQLSAPNDRMPVDVAECNKFSQVGVLSVWELANLCLDIDLTKPSSKRVGFGKED